MADRRLLLVSSSVTHGTGYLDHCEAELLDLFEGVRSVLFVPYALHDRDAYAAKARAKFEALGFELSSLHEASDPRRVVAEATGVFIGGGNTFRLLKTLYAEGLVAPLAARARQGMPYMGTSAGSNVAGMTIRTSNDMPIVDLPSFDALALAPIQINPHYVDADLRSTHQGETRDQRLAEYLEENTRPVIALREGAMLRIRGNSMTLLGSAGGRLFSRTETRDLTAGTSLDDLLAEPDAPTED